MGESKRSMKRRIAELECSWDKEMSSITRNFATYPLRLHISKTGADCAHVFVLGYGGGMVGGDCVELKCEILENAQLCLRTQGSTKIFKSNEPVASRVATRQFTTVNIGPNGFVCMIPDHITCFKDARYAQETTYNLESTSNLCLVEWYS
jgi:urease accessory protein